MLAHHFSSHYYSRRCMATDDVKNWPMWSAMICSLSCTATNHVSRPRSGFRELQPGCRQIVSRPNSRGGLHESPWKLNPWPGLELLNILGEVWLFCRSWVWRLRILRNLVDFHRSEMKDQAMSFGWWLDRSDPCFGKKLLLISLKNDVGDINLCMYVQTCCMYVCIPPTSHSPSTLRLFCVNS